MVLVLQGCCSIITIGVAIVESLDLLSLKFSEKIADTPFWNDSMPLFSSQRLHDIIQLSALLTGSAILASRVSRA